MSRWTTCRGECTGRHPKDTPCLTPDPSKVPNRAPIQRTIRVTEDIGGPFPVLKDAYLELRTDGTVTWERVDLAR